MKLCNCLIVVGLWYFNSAFTLSGLTLTPFPSIMCPKCSISCKKKLHLSGLSLKFALSNLLNTRRKCCLCSSAFLLYTKMSSKYTWHMLSLMQSSRTCSIILWKAGGAECIPKGNTLNWKCPSGVIKALASDAASVSGTWWYPLARSRFEKTLAPLNLSKMSSILGNGCANFTDCAFILL